MNKSLSRNVAFWLLIVLSLASAVGGGWLISTQVGTMTSTLLEGTATGVEVYVGQSLVVVGAATLGAGIIGLLLALGLAAVTSVVSRRGHVVEPASYVEEVDLPSEHTPENATIIVAEEDTTADAESIDADVPEPAVSR